MPGLTPANRSLQSSNIFREGDVVLLRMGKNPVVTGKVIRVYSPTRYCVSVSGAKKYPHLNQMVLAPPA